MKIAEILDIADKAGYWTDYIETIQDKLRDIYELMPEIKEVIACCMVDALSDRERTIYADLIAKLGVWENE